MGEWPGFALDSIGSHRTRGLVGGLAVLPPWLVVDRGWCSIMMRFRNSLIGEEGAKVAAKLAVLAGNSKGWKSVGKFVLRPAIRSNTIAWLAMGEFIPVASI